MMYKGNEGRGVYELLLLCLFMAVLSIILRKKHGGGAWYYRRQMGLLCRRMDGLVGLGGWITLIPPTFLVFKDCNYSIIHFFFVLRLFCLPERDVCCCRSEDVNLQRATKQKPKCGNRENKFIHHQGIQRVEPCHVGYSLVFLFKPIEEPSCQSL
jgi:hypothetical protein